jgi:hypothetical protein
VANKKTLNEIDLAQLILHVDSGRAATDPFKLPASLHAPLVSAPARVLAHRAAAAIVLRRSE